MAVVVKETIADLQKPMFNRKKTESKHHNKDEHSSFYMRWPVRTVKIQSYNTFYTHTRSV